MRKLWTTEEDDKIKLMRSQGMTYPQMVPHLPDRNLRTISVRANKILPPVKSMKAWTQEEEDQLVQLREDKVPYKEIAEIMGRSYSSVKTKGSALITSKSPRPASKTYMEEKKQVAFQELTELEAEFIETGQDYFRF
jgi:hypothetical protein